MSGEDRRKHNGLGPNDPARDKQSADCLDVTGSQRWCEVESEQAAPMCFGCGKLNPIGLKMDFCSDGEDLVSEFMPTDSHSGYPGIMHGGIVCTLLDEVMAKVLFSKGYVAYTASMEVRFRHMAAIGKPVRCIGRIIAKRGRVFICHSELRDARGRVLAEAMGKYVSKQEENNGQNKGT